MSHSYSYHVFGKMVNVLGQEVFMFDGIVGTSFRVTTVSDYRELKEIVRKELSLQAEVTDERKMYIQNLTFLGKIDENGALIDV